jgi:hypothetical protein
MNALLALLHGSSHEAQTRLTGCTSYPRMVAKKEGLSVRAARKQDGSQSRKQEERGLSFFQIAGFRSPFKPQKQCSPLDMV